MVIENKVFSLPDWEQLERIAGKFAGQRPRLVLLSLTRPSWEGEAWPTSHGDVWTLLSYDELAQRLRPTIPQVSAANEYAGATLGRWLDMVDRLGELTAAVGQPGLDEPLQLPRSQRELLLEARLDASVQKMRYQRVAVELGAHGLDAYVNLTNGTGMVEWFTDSPRGFRWGWQLQGEQFRLAIIVPEAHPGYGKGAKYKAATPGGGTSAPGLLPVRFDHRRWRRGTNPWGPVRRLQPELCLPLRAHPGRHRGPGRRAGCRAREADHDRSQLVGHGGNAPCGCPSGVDYPVSGVVTVGA